MLLVPALEVLRAAAVLITGPVILGDASVAVLATSSLAISASPGKNAVDLRVVALRQWKGTGICNVWTYHNVNASFEYVANLDDTAKIQEFAIIKDLQRSSNVE
jgi:hypothetical protein